MWSYLFHKLWLHLFQELLVIIFVSGVISWLVVIKEREGRPNLISSDNTLLYQPIIIITIIQLCQDILILSTGIGVQEHNYRQVVKRKFHINLKFEIQDGHGKFHPRQIQILKSWQISPQTNENFCLQSISIRFDM